MTVSFRWLPLSGAALAMCLAVQAWAQTPQPGWLSDARTGCRVWSLSVQPNKAVSWSGQCRDGLAQGSGSLDIFVAGNPIGHFQGTLLNGKADGPGVFTTPNGARYEGGFQEGKYHGHGVLSLPNGDRTEGDFRDSQLNGQGTARYADGSRYEGAWRDGKPNGHGTYTATTGYRLTGEFRDGKYVDPAAPTTPRAEQNPPAAPDTLNPPILLNPLDWPAVPFLSLYAGLLAVVLAVVVLRRRAFGGVATTLSARPLDLLELAYLGRGPAHVANTVMLGLMASGAAQFTARTLRAPELKIDPGAVPLPRELQPFRDAAVGATNPAAFRKSIAPGIEAIRQSLRDRGLAPTAAAVAGYRWLTAVLFLLVLVLGGLKVAVGLSRGRPVEILLVLLVLTLVIALAAVLATPVTTRAGREALREARAANARAARAPTGDELTLAFALGGAAMLVGTPFAAFGKYLSQSGADGSGSDGGGGSGCGGCSGT